MGHARPKSAPPVDGAPQGLLRGAADAPGLPLPEQRHLRADLAPGREHQRERWPRAEAAGIPYWIVGHVGDGNFHLSYLIDPERPGEMAAVER
jgi:FAD/FMN-containing dehydrogenase